MPRTEMVLVKDLELDLHNFRTVPQPNELTSVQAMLTIKQDRFWPLTESILEDGYRPTENIIVQKSKGSLIVKEGNRRVAALKLILGLLDRSKLDIPANIDTLINGIQSEWRKTNERIPCAVYNENEQDAVTKVISQTHAKGDKAGRDTWTAVARARYNRDVNQGSEPGLILLEAYLKTAKNVTEVQRERWAGDYPLTVLDESLKRIAPRLGFKSSREFADAYPVRGYRKATDSLVYDIGIGITGFPHIRATPDILVTKYKFPEKQESGGTSTTSGASATASAGTANSSTSSSNSTGTAQSTTAQSGQSASSAGTGTQAVAQDDVRSVKRALRALKPRGNGRDKLVRIIKEAHDLNIVKTPTAFCLLLRAMFELSAKAYCDDHARNGGPRSKDNSGQDRNLAVVLDDIAKHLTNNMQDKQMVRAIHGALTELKNPNGLLSVTSLNQLIHSPTFSIDDRHICTTFGSILPMLKVMNNC